MNDDNWGQPEEITVLKYSRDHFYTTGYGKADSSREIRIHMPPRFRDQIHAAIENHPVYRGNVSAFARDAFAHRLHDMAEMNGETPLIREMLGIILAEQRLAELAYWRAKRKEWIEELEKDHGDSVEEKVEFARRVEEIVLLVRDTWPEWIRGPMLRSLSRFREEQ